MVLKIGRLGKYIKKQAETFKNLVMEKNADQLERSCDKCTW